MMMGAWRRWADHPAPSDLPDRLGVSAERHWRSLTAWLHERYAADGEPAWTDEDGGWSLRFRAGGRALVTLRPTEDGAFEALVVLGPTLWDAVDDLDLAPATWAAFNHADAYVDGRWLRLQVGDSQALRDVRKLVALKAPAHASGRPLRPVMDERAVARRARERERERELSGLR